MHCDVFGTRKEHRMGEQSAATFEMTGERQKKRNHRFLVASVTETHQITYVVLVTGKLQGKKKALMSCKMTFDFYFRIDLCVFCQEGHSANRKRTLHLR